LIVPPITFSPGVLVTGMDSPVTIDSSTALRPSAAAALPMVSGTVEKVDAAAGKITIEHGPIPSLNMEAMTMVFRTQDPKSPSAKF
jgi:Cu/Ag efflux protein CusF